MTEGKSKYEAKEQNKPEKPPVHFTEAPASVNIKFQWQGFDIMLTIRDEKVNSALKKMEAAIGHLQDLGAEPHQERGSSGNNAGGNDDTKVCPIHHVAMRKREKHGEVWWSHKAINPETNEEYWCKGVAK